MNIIARGTLLYYIKKYPKAKNSLLYWYQDFIKCTFISFNELKTVYGNASIIENNRVIFNIKGNDFRLIISCNLKKDAVYIIWFGTHKEYDQVDASTAEFDINILNLKKL